MRRMLLFVGSWTLLLPAAAAHGAGGPVPPVQGGAGATAPGGAVSVVALGLRPQRTFLEQVLKDGAIGRTLELRGTYGVPGVAYDGSTTGLSADGRTAVLAEIPRRYPVHRSRFVVVDARRMRVLRRFSLPGLSTVDAIAPDGRVMYLIRYRDQGGLSYEVRAYDLVRHRLLRAPVVDLREPEEDMQGIPMTRTMSADGRWAYTLYQRPNGEPFIHALDTAGRAAACIDLPALEGADFSGARLVAPRAGRPLLVQTTGRPALAVDVAARTARPLPVAPVTPAAAPAPHPAPAAADDGGAPIDLVAGLAAFAALGLGLGGIGVARRWRSATAA